VQTVQTPDQLLNLDPTSLALIVLRTLVVYLVLLVALRLSGKRALGQMTPFDLVVLLIISNAVQNAMVGPDTSLNGGLLAALALLALDRGVDRLALRTDRLRLAVIGSPALLVYNGDVVMDHLKAEGLTESEVLQALREHGVDDLAAVKSAVLEVDGTISVIPRDAPSSHTRRRIRGRKPTA
jgi:uncharacterized membrane protein YcaP (DUF421 family)